jgi:hypothetical protein
MIDTLSAFVFGILIGTMICIGSMYLTDKQDILQHETEYSQYLDEVENLQILEQRVKGE